MKSGEALLAGVRKKKMFSIGIIVMRNNMIGKCFLWIGYQI